MNLKDPQIIVHTTEKSGTNTSVGNIDFEGTNNRRYRKPAIASAVQIDNILPLLALKPLRGSLQHIQKTWP